MSTTPMMRVDDTIVVFEGPARILWTRGPGDRWTPTGLWPDRRHRAELEGHLRAGRPLLVVVDQADTPVLLLREEWDRAPERFRATLGGSGQDAGDVLELWVPLLDWLPETTRARARRFLRETDAVLAGTAAALLPSVLTDAPADEVGDALSLVRFLRRPSPAAVSSVQLAAAVRRLSRGSAAVDDDLAVRAG